MVTIPQCKKYKRPIQNINYANITKLFAVSDYDTQNLKTLTNNTIITLDIC